MDHEPSVDIPPSETPGRRGMMRRCLSALRPIGEAALIGLSVGFLDTRTSDSGGWTIFGFLLGGFVLGLRHAGRAALCWPVLGSGLYVAHVIAIACGRTQPFVEENNRFAELNLLMIVPAGVGLLGGVAVRAILAGHGLFPRKSGPPFALLPQAVRGVQLTVASWAVSLALIHRALFPPTIYAPGYDESRFHSIRPGMTEAEVVKRLGEPLGKVPWPGGPSINWQYSNQYTYTSNYYRRWIFMMDGRVESVVSDYWWD